MKRRFRCGLPGLICVALLGFVLVPAVETSPAAAAGRPVLFDQDFGHAALGASAIRIPPLSPERPERPNTACLTTGGTRQAPLYLPICPQDATSDPLGSLRLTAAAPDQTGAAFSKVPVPTTPGLEFSFTSYQYGAQRHSR